MLLDDNVVAQRQTKTRSFTSGLRRKEGIEHLFLHLGRNAGAAVTDPDLHSVAKGFGRGSKGGLITIAFDLGFTLSRRVKAVGNQVQNHPCDFLGKHVDLPSVGIKGPLQGDIEALFLGPRPVISEIEAFLDQRVDIDRSMLARALARVQQHILDDRICALAVLHHFVETAEKLLTKLSGFLISCAMPAVSWPSEASFSVCTRRSCAVRRSFSERESSRVRSWTCSNRRTLLMAMTAWSAKDFRSSICLSLKGCTSMRRSEITPIASPSCSNGTLRTVR